MNQSAPTKCPNVAWAIVVAGALVSVGVGGCGAAPSNATPGDSSALSSCSIETRAIQYTPDLSRPSASGAFTAILVKSDPGPPIKGTNTWTLKILDSTGAPQDGLAITTVANMPDHNHPPSVVALVTGKGGGVYE